MMSKGQKELFHIVFLNRPHFRFLILLLSLTASVFGLAVPYFQKLLSESLETHMLLICVGLALCYLAANQLANFVGQSESLKAQHLIAEKIYKHNLKLKPLTLHNRPTGELVSLYSTDVPSLTVWLEQSLPYGLTTLFPLILTPYFLFYFYDLSLSFSLSFVAVLILINSLMAYRQSIFFFKFKVLAAARMGLVNEWIQNIRGLKVLNWVEGFENKIIKKRREETINRIRMVTNGQVMNSVSSNMMFWLNLALLAFLIWFYEKDFSRSDIIALLWVTTVFLSRPLRQLPWFFTFVFDAWTSFNRLAQFLDLENEPEQILNSGPSDPDALIECQNLSLEIQGHALLQNINLKIYRSEIIALIGPVGAGKTLLLKSLIKETPFKADQFYSTDISYLPQEHFIMSATLRDNMNFQYESDHTNDETVMHNLSRSQFSFELDRIENGLETQIGERGVNLSGGQKQRISLARQLMISPQVFIFDDPLSAVDVSTESQLISEFVRLKQNGHSLLLTTQRFTALPHCDRIVYIDKGRILYDGKASSFLSRPEYQAFLKGLEN